MKVIGLLEKILAVVFWGLLIFGFDTAFMAVLTILSALIHEGGHILALLFVTNGKMHLPRGALFGFWITPKGMLSYKSELLTVLGGPFINILLGILLIFFHGSGFGGYLRIFGLINLMTAFSNLLPIKGYDGYKAVILSCALLFGSFDRCERVLSRISFALISVFTLFALWLMNKIGEGYWIFMIFFCSLIKEMAERQEHTFYEN